MVALDALGQARQVDLDGRLDGGVLVLGVGDEQVDEVVDPVGEGQATGAVGRVDPTGVDGGGEQLGPDALVDVAVEVDGDDAEVAGRLGAVVVAGGWVMVTGCPPSGATRRRAAVVGRS